MSFLLRSAQALTITTFNILAPVNRSIDALNHSESEREEWWRPRAERVAKYIADNLVRPRSNQRTLNTLSEMLQYNILTLFCPLYMEQSSSDVVMLQEWWSDEKFTAIFDSITGHLFERKSERRPGMEGKMRDDGMCCLVRKRGKLEFMKSDKVLTGPQRIAQIVQCRERLTDGMCRYVFLANAHLSFPGDKDPVVNDERQVNEASIILQALAKASYEFNRSFPGNECLEVICGDFNSNSCGLAASLLESPPYNFINCASATAQQILTNIGGQVNIGVTHCNHLGQKVSVDHIFLRFRPESRNGLQVSRFPQKDRCASLALGYLDTKGTRVLNVRRGDNVIEGSVGILSDHRPVSATIEWPRMNDDMLSETFKSDMYQNVTMPLDPLEPAWGIVQQVD